MSSSQSRSRSGHSSSKDHSSSRSRSAPVYYIESRWNWPFFLATFIPFTFFLLFGLAGVYTISVFVFKPGDGGQYGIGAEGYHTSYGDELAGPRFNYPVPQSWTFPVNHIPKILLFHFIASLLLFFYLIYLAGIFISVARNLRMNTAGFAESRRRVTEPQRASERVLHAFMMLSCGGIVFTDVVVWGLGASGYGLLLTPDVLGYFIIVLGMALWLTWLVMQVIMFFRR